MNGRAPRVVVLCDRFPEATETFVVNEVRALRRLGIELAVEAVVSPQRPAAVDERATVWERDSTATRLRAVLRLVLRHPWRALRDLVDRRRWRRDEEVFPLRMLAPAAGRLRASGPVHIHVHFAATAALSAMRLARIEGIPWSLTAHAYDIYQRPANLREKLAAASFATSGCRYTVEDLQRIAGAPRAGRIHEVIMGVDAEEFRRRTPHPEQRLVVAVGRLVEKKGFLDLVDAVAEMRGAGRSPERVVIAGEGPQRDELAARIAGHGLGEVVELAGPLDHGRVRDLLERAAVLCMPCVIAADGDRDSMPVVVKEALAMEVPVVATDEVGLPEIVDAQCGRLVAPRDPTALARALDELLALPAAERAAMGRAGRARVLELCDPTREAARLADLIRGAQAVAVGTDRARR